MLSKYVFIITHNYWCYVFKLISKHTSISETLLWCGHIDNTPYYTCFHHMISAQSCYTHLGKRYNFYCYDIPDHSLTPYIPILLVDKVWYRIAPLARHYELTRLSYVIQKFKVDSLLVQVTVMRNKSTALWIWRRLTIYTRKR